MKCPPSWNVKAFLQYTKSLIFRQLFLSIHETGSEGNTSRERGERMKIGTVLGPVHLASCAPGFDEMCCKQVRVEDQILVAADLAGTNSGDLVLLTLGSVAAGYRMDLRCDALIVAVVDKEK